ncbi:MAG: signal peptidase II [Candidatus Woesearchaeota archaeon]
MVDIKKKSYIVMLIVALLLFVLDRSIKHLVYIYLEQPIQLLPYVYITHIYNTGIAFGIGQSGNMFFFGLSIFIMLFLLYVAYTQPSRYHIGFACILGGALGNTIDRIIYGGVLDYVHIWMFPIFNVADVCITLGAVYILYVSYTKKEVKTS